MGLSEQQKQALRARKNQQQQPADNVSRETSELHIVADLQAQQTPEEEFIEQQFNQAEQARADILQQDEDLQFLDPTEEVDMRVAAPRDNFAIVEGFQVPANATEEEREALSENVFSYVGVIPRPVDQYVGRWIKCLGCVLMPVEAEKEYVNQVTGEVTKRMITWDAPLFKIEAIDDITGAHVILTGGGKYGKLFAKQMTSLFGAGDWRRPKEIFISQEARTGADGKPRRMYRFTHRRVNAK